jgi:hypothetical protein
MRAGASFFDKHVFDNVKFLLPRFKWSYDNKVFWEGEIGASLIWRTHEKSPAKTFSACFADVGFRRRTA